MDFEIQKMIQSLFEMVFSNHWNWLWYKSNSKDGFVFLIF